MQHSRLYAGRYPGESHIYMLTIVDSIFFDNDRTIFATFKYVGDDWDGDMKRMRENPKVREWWALTDGMQVCLDGFSVVSGRAMMTDLFHRKVLFLVLWAVQRGLDGGRCWMRFFMLSDQVSSMYTLLSSRHTSTSKRLLAL